jgi:hypothetical protein
MPWALSVPILLVGLAVLGGACCVTVSARSLRKIRPSVLGRPELALRALRDDQRAHGVDLPTSDAAWQLVVAVKLARHPKARVAELNERLLEVERTTGNVAHTPRAAARIALTIGAACAVLSVARAATEPSAVIGAVVALGAGAAAGTVCLWIGVKASQSVGACRHGYRKLARWLIR